MILFINENQALKNNSYPIPNNLLKHLKNTLVKLGKYKETPGYKRLNTLVSPNYNNKTGKEKKGTNYTVSFGDMKRILHDFKNIDPKYNKISYDLNGGDQMRQWVSDTLNRERTKVEPVLKQKKIETRNANATKPYVAPSKPISVGNITANVHESHSHKRIYIREDKIPLLNGK